MRNNPLFRLINYGQKGLTATKGLLVYGHFFRQAGVMTASQALGMLLGASGSIWAARCLGPQNLGISGMVQNFVMFAAMMLGVIQPPVLVREYKNHGGEISRRRLVQSSTTFRILCAGICCALWTLLMAFQILPSEYAFTGWFFIPLLLFGGALPTWIFQAAGKQQALSLLTTFQYALVAGMYFWFLRPGAAAGSDLAVLSMASLLTLPVFLIVLSKLTPSRGHLLNFRSLGHAVGLIGKSKWLFFSALTTYACAVLEQPLLGWLHSLDELGRYRTAVSVAAVAQVFVSIILELLYPRFLEWRKIGEGVLWRRQLKLIAFCSAIGSPGVIAVFLVVPRVYPFVFGSEFQAAAFPCAILLASKFVLLPAGILLFGLMSNQEHDKSIFICTMVAALGSTAVNAVLIPKYGATVAALTSLGVQVTLFLMYFFIGYRRITAFRALE